MPILQLAHAVAPTTVLTWPAGHETGADMPAEAQYVPNGHGVRALTPVVQNDPATHGRHTDEPLVGAYDLPSDFTMRATVT